MAKYRVWVKRSPQKIKLEKKFQKNKKRGLPNSPRVGYWGGWGYVSLPWQKIVA